MNRYSRRYGSIIHSIHLLIRKDMIKPRQRNQGSKRQKRPRHRRSRTLVCRGCRPGRKHTQKTTNTRLTSGSIQVGMAPSYTQTHYPSTHQKSHDNETKESKNIRDHATEGAKCSSRLHIEQENKGHERLTSGSIQGGMAPLCTLPSPGNGAIGVTEARPEKYEKATQMSTVK